MGIQLRIETHPRKKVEYYSHAHLNEFVVIKEYAVFNPFPPHTIPRSYRILSLLIHISPNNCAINMIQVGKLVVNALAIHCAFQTMSIGPLLMKLLYLYVMRW